MGLASFFGMGEPEQATVPPPSEHHLEAARKHKAQRESLRKANAEHRSKSTGELRKGLQDVDAMVRDIKRSPSRP